MFIAVETINFFILTQPWRKWYNVWQYLNENFSYWNDDLVVVWADALDEERNGSWSSELEPKNHKGGRVLRKSQGQERKLFESLVFEERF